MDRNSALSYVKQVAHNHIPKNSRGFKFRFINSLSPGQNFLGFFIDPKPFEGKVVEQEAGLLLVKEGRTSLTGIPLALIDGEIPKVGATIKVEPYARHRFDGRRLDDPDTRIETTKDGQQREVLTLEIGQGRLELPLEQSPRCPELKAMIDQLVGLDAPDSPKGYRKISHMLADANATDFQLVDPDPNNTDECHIRPAIAFSVDTPKFKGRVQIRYEWGRDTYTVLHSPGFDDNEPQDFEDRCWKDVYFDQLGEVLGRIFDDGSWKRVKVTQVTKARASTRSRALH